MSLYTMPETHPLDIAAFTAVHPEVDAPHPTYNREMYRGVSAGDFPSMAEWERQQRAWRLEQSGEQPVVAAPSRPTAAEQAMDPTPVLKFSADDEFAFHTLLARLNMTSPDNTPIQAAPELTRHHTKKSLRELEAAAEHEALSFADRVLAQPAADAHHAMHVQREKAAEKARARRIDRIILAAGVIAISAGITIMSRAAELNHFFQR